MGDVVRVYTWLVKRDDMSLCAAWNTDLALNPFILEILSGNTNLPNSDTGSLRVRPDRYETDSADAPVRVTAADGVVVRTLHSEDDEDWFLITIPENSSRFILETSGDMDNYMELYDGDSHSRLARNDDGGEDGNARIEYSGEPGKTYIVKVQGYDGEIGSYGFSVVFEAYPEDTAEPNDSLEQATRIDRTSVRGLFRSPSDEDWYVLPIPTPGSQVTVFTAGDMDTIITLYDENGNKLAEDDDSGSGDNARVSVVVYDKALYIKVEEYDGALGSYILGVEIREPAVSDSYEPDDSPSDAKEIGIGSSQERTFTFSNDVDWVRFVVVERGVYEIRTKAADGYLDSYITLYDGKDHQMQEDDDSGGDYDAYLSVELDPGTYMLKVECLDDDPLQNNAYTLSIVLKASGTVETATSKPAPPAVFPDPNSAR
jgi:hypothetical protein